jgi:hypothetical protein
MAIYSGKIHYKWWFSIAMLNYQRVYKLVLDHLDLQISKLAKSTKQSLHKHRPLIPLVTSYKYPSYKQTWWHKTNKRNKSVITTHFSSNVWFKINPLTNHTYQHVPQTEVQTVHQTCFLWTWGSICQIRFIFYRVHNQTCSFGELPRLHKPTFGHIPPYPISFVFYHVMIGIHTHNFVGQINGFWVKSSCLFHGCIYYMHQISNMCAIPQLLRSILHQKHIRWNIPHNYPNDSFPKMPNHPKWYRTF